MKSTSSTSVSRRSVKLSRTLRRKYASFRLANEEDLKYLWAYYKKNGLQDVTPEKFREDAVNSLAKFDCVWMLESRQKPVGMILANQCGPITMIDNIVWFPWAFKRQVLETLIHFLNTMRNLMVMMGHTDMNTKTIYEKHIAPYGVIRRVGSLHDLYKDQPAAIWQTRKL